MVQLDNFLLFFILNSPRISTNPWSFILKNTVCYGWRKHTKIFLHSPPPCEYLLQRSWDWNIIARAAKVRNSVTNSMIEPRTQRVVLNRTSCGTPRHLWSFCSHRKKSTYTPPNQPFCIAQPIRTFFFRKSRRGFLKYPYSGFVPECSPDHKGIRALKRFVGSRRYFFNTFERNSSFTPCVHSSFASCCIFHCLRTQFSLSKLDALSAWYCAPIGVPNIFDTLNSFYLPSNRFNTKTIVLTPPPNIRNKTSTRHVLLGSPKLSTGNNIPHQNSPLIT